MKKGVWIVGILFFLRIVHGQVPFFFHADDVLLKNKITQNPEVIIKYLIFEENLKQLMTTLEHQYPKTDTLINGKRVIPVVFHIIHTYGSENISDEQVLDGLTLLNIDFNKLNPDTANTYHLFKSRAADCKIEFRLARKDPNGNCTSGIVRHYDPSTNFAYFETMAQYAWEPKHYMNVFVVKNIYPSDMSLPDGAFIGGMSPFPPNNPLSQMLTGGDTLKDGVLIRHDGVGSIGTATQMGGMPINMINRTFTHEAGHYFNLYHTFQNLMAGLIPSSSGCPSFLAPNGDEVSDTPPVDQATINTSVQCYPPGSRNTCTENPDEPDMIENYMDYQWGYCNNIFTLGQKARIDATLNGYRRSLWSKENLIKTGVLDTNTQLCSPIADFYTPSPMICQGGTVQFYDASFNGPVENWIWEFEGGTPSSSTQKNPLVTYDQGGIFKVKLKVFNSSGMDSLVKTNYIHVWSNSQVIDAPYFESFENGGQNNFLSINEAGGSWTLKTGTGCTGTKSMYVPNFQNGRGGSKDILVSPVYNLTTFTGQAVKISFKYAYAGKIIPGSIITPSDTAFDKFLVAISSDCGKTWQTKLSYSGPSWATANPTQNEFSPTSPSQWKTAEFIIPAGQVSQLNRMRIKFEFFSNGGNNLYLDDININLLSAGMEDLRSILKIYPNPVQDELHIDFTDVVTRSFTYVIYDIVGNEVVRGILYNTHEIINVAHLKSGTYCINLISDRENFSIMFVK
ncbi:MAG: M43 family zinc metalloprotease [Bacteroidales bacterium]|nr:M43 family zinc metalloprotease [Bacteroidales bacterium]